MYLSNAGDDTAGDGSETNPWATLAAINALDLQPGDRVLLNGGDSFAGSLAFDAQDAGDDTAPVVVTSYGTGRATIAPGVDEHGIEIYNTAGISISDLIIDGGNLSLHNKVGIQAYMDLPGTVRLYGLSISNCELMNLRMGIAIGAWASDNSYSGFGDVTISDCLVHDIEHDGIASWGMYPGSETNQSHRNIQVLRTEVTGVTGDPDKTNGHSGSGIIVSGTIGGLIEDCYAHHNGGGGGETSGGGPIGIWTWDAVAVTIRRCLVHDQKTIAGAVDGGGFDLDGGAVNCVIEYCYSYNNEGGGYLFAEFSGASPLRGNVVRYNVSYNDGTKNSMGGIHFWSGSSAVTNLEDNHIYNNLIVSGPSSTGPVVRYQSGAMQNITLQNNIFVSQRGLDLVQINNRLSAFTFDHNCWYATDGNHDYRWGGTTYSSLSDWQTASGTGVEGLETDPLLVDLATMPTPTSVAALDELSAITLMADSPCIDSGTSIADPGPYDFFGTNLPTSGPLDRGPSQYQDLSLLVQAVNPERIQLRWQAEASADLVLVERQHQDNQLSLRLLASDPGFAYDDTFDAALLSQYLYSVSSYEYDGAALLLNESRDQSVVDMGLQQSEQNGDILVDWTDITNADWYHLMRQETTQGNVLRIIFLPIDPSSYLDQDVQTGSSYRYEVSAGGNTVLGNF